MIRLWNILRTELAIWRAKRLIASIRRRQL